MNFLFRIFRRDLVILFKCDLCGFLYVINFLRRGNRLKFFFY